MDFLVGVYNRYKKTFWWLFGFTAVLYSFFMVNQLSNTWDGFWHQDYHMASHHEISCGRWLLPVFDKILRGLHLEPINTLAVIALFAASFVVALYALDISDSAMTVIGGVVLFSSPILSAVISYRYVAVAFGVSCLLSCVGSAVCIKLKNNVAAVLIPACLLGISMSIYQVYIGTFCLIGVLSLMLLVADGESAVKDMITRAVRYIIAVPVGGILYFIMMQISLKVTGVKLSDYDDASDASFIGIITSLPSTLPKTFKIFFDYIRGRQMIMSSLDGRLKVTLIYHLIFAVLVLALFIYKITKAGEAKVLRYLLLALCVVLIPLGTNFSNILATTAGFAVQMGIPMGMFSALLPIVLASHLKETPVDGKKVLPVVMAVVCICTVYGQSAQVLTDHFAMKEGYTATETLAQGVVSDLQRRGLLGTDKPFFFIGEPSRNKTFYTTEAYDKANEYARIGDFWLFGSNEAGSYRALFQRVMGVDLNVISDFYETKAYDEYYQTVPSYPDDGYILDWDTIIIKISEP